MESLEQDYLTVNDVAKLLGVHRTTIRSWIKKDLANKKGNYTFTRDEAWKITCPPYVRVGHKCRFLRTDIEKFMKDLKGG